jgi:hypothetical protein
LKEGGRHCSAWWQSICRIREGLGESVGRWFDNNIRRVVGDGNDTLFWHDTWVRDFPLRTTFPRLYDLALNKECSVVEARRDFGAVGGWERVWRRRLFAWEEEGARECSILLNNTVLQENVHDTWRWLLDPIHGYSVKGAYHFLTTTGQPLDRTLVDDVWQKHIPSKVSVFVWRLLRNRLPTKDNLVQRQVIQNSDTACITGCGGLETATHLFLHCNIFSSLWYNVYRWLHISSVTPSNIRQHFIQFTSMAGLPRSTYTFLKIIWFASVWVLWKERNNRVFQNKVSTPYALVEQVKLNSFLWLKSKQVNFGYSYHDWWQHPILCMGVHM